MSQFKYEEKVVLTLTFNTTGKHCNSMHTFERYLYDHLHFFGDEGYVQADDIKLTFDDNNTIAVYEMAIRPINIWFLARSYQKYCAEKIIE